MRLSSTLLATSLLSLLGCGQKHDAQTRASASATVSAAAAPSVSGAAAPAPPWLGINRPESEVAKVINPLGQAPYSGKTAILKGTIRIDGDEPSDTKLSFDAKCARAKDVYQKLFRKGPKGELADAMVAVTEYQGFVPATKPAVELTIDGCAYSQRTVAAAFGQRIDVKNLDPSLSFMPYLDGAPVRAVMVALPGGSPVKLYPTEVSARYLVRDMMNRPFMLAEVFVVPYATFAVTDVAGKYEIRGIPVGKVRVDAFLPAIDKSVRKEAELVEGENNLDISIHYDKAKDVPATVPEPIWGDRNPPPFTDVSGVPLPALSAPNPPPSPPK